MSIFRTIARRSLRSIGLQPIHHPSFVALMKRDGIKSVLDVGANVGKFGEELRERGYRGRIASFEPISSVYAKLEQAAARDPDWATFRSGVGDVERELEISVAAATVFSSFKQPSTYTANKFVGAKEERRETVPVIRLDRFLTQHPEYLENCYLKIDTQGFEQEVLDGTGDLLTRLSAIQLELPIRQLYEGQRSLVETIEWMAARGFHIAMAKENGFDWDQVRLLELDIVFTRAG